MLGEFSESIKAAINGFCAPDWSHALTASAASAERFGYPRDPGGSEIPTMRWLIFGILLASYGSHKPGAHDDFISRRLLEIVEGLRPVGR
jgi:hypothetical protein